MTKKRYTPHLNNEFISTENFAELLDKASSNKINERTVIEGKVVGIDKDCVIVDVGLKNEGRIPLSEFGSSTIEVGNLIDVYVEKIEGRNGRTILSRKEAVRQEAWTLLEKAHEKGEQVSGIIFGRVKGGYTVDLSGVVAFLPGSQADLGQAKDLSPIMGISQPFQILKMDKKLGNIVVSRRAILEEETSEVREAMLAQVQEGMVVEGIVKNIVAWGAFLKIYLPDTGTSGIGLDALLHISDISWQRANHPSELLAIGQKIKVKIIKYSADTKRISVGVKQLEDNPWKDIGSHFPVGKVVDCEVSNILHFGISVKLNDNLEGLIHSSELSWSKSYQNPKKIVSIGQHLKAVITEVDADKPKISLSLKRTTPNPWAEFANKHKVGDVLTCKVRNIADFAIFVALNEGEEANIIDGIIHESDISWSGKNKESLKKYNVGDEVECKILSIDLDHERVSLGIKQLSENNVESAMQDLSKGQNVECTVTAVESDGIEVKTGELTSFIKKAELSNDKAESDPSKFEVGSKVTAKITAIDKSTKKITLSIKAFENDEQQKLVKGYGSDSNTSLGEILGEALKDTSK